MNGGILENLLFFINFNNIPNFFFADKDGLRRVSLIVLWKEAFARRLAVVESFAASLDFL